MEQGGLPPAIFPVVDDKVTFLNSEAEQRNVGRERSLDKCGDAGPLIYQEYLMFEDGALIKVKSEQVLSNFDAQYNDVTGSKERTGISSMKSGTCSTVDVKEEVKFEIMIHEGLFQTSQDLLPIKLENCSEDKDNQRSCSQSNFNASNTNHTTSAEQNRGSGFQALSEHPSATAENLCQVSTFSLDSRNTRSSQSEINMDTGNDLQPPSVPETSCGREQLIDTATSSAPGTSDPETSPTDTSNTSQSTDSGEPSRHPPTSSAEKDFPNDVSVFQCLYCRKTFKRKGGLTTHMRRHFVDQKGYKKPTRPCPFCDLKQTKVARHIAKRHATHPEVINVLKLPKGSAEIIQAFAKFRKEGIHKYNLKQARLKRPSFLCERRNKSIDLVMCANCKGYYGQKSFFHHKKFCIGGELNNLSPERLKQNSGTDQEGSYKKPTRPCPFCDLKQTKIERHITRRHATHPEVINVLKLPKGSAERIQAFAKFRKEGIHKHNLKQAALKSPTLLCEKRSQSTGLIMCVKCKGYYGRSTFNRHDKSCTGEDRNTVRLGRYLNNSDRDQKSVKKPTRPCPFCSLGQTKIKRHIEQRHSTLPEVANALRLPKGSAERTRAFDKFRKEGILKHNLKQAGLMCPRFICERRNRCADLVMCVKCKGFYARKSFYKHKKSCFGADGNDDSPDRGKLVESQRKRRGKGSRGEENLGYDTTPTMRFRWNTSSTEKIRSDFEEWICLPKGNHLPSKITLLEYMGDNPIGCTYQQLRTKIMNEQNKHQANTSDRVKKWQGFYKRSRYFGHKKFCKRGHGTNFRLDGGNVRRSRRKRRVEDTNVEEDSETELTTRKSRRIGETCEEELSAEATRVPVDTEQTTTPRFKWNASLTQKIHRDFAEWVCLRDGNHLPSKITLLEYMGDNPIGCTYQQLRAKIMNEQNKRQADKSETEETRPTDKIRRSGRKRLVEEGSKEESLETELSPTVRFKWDAKSTEKIKCDFAEWIGLPEGNRLPSKTALIQYMDDNLIGCTYQQLRTKIMNEQNKHQTESRNRGEKGR